MTSTNETYHFCQSWCKCCEEHLLKQNQNKIHTRASWKKHIQYLKNLIKNDPNFDIRTLNINEYNALYPR